MGLNSNEARWPIEHYSRRGRTEDIPLRDLMKTDTNELGPHFAFMATAELNSQVFIRLMLKAVLTCLEQLVSNAKAWVREKVMLSLRRNFHMAEDASPLEILFFSVGPFVRNKSIGVRWPGAFSLYFVWLT